MTTPYITPTVHYIGVDDLTIDLFENQYPVPQGMSYNSYLLLDEQIAIIDTVDRRYVTTWLSQLEAKLEGRTPTYLIVEHLEPDHSAGIAALCARYPQVRLVMSARAAKMLPLFFPDDTTLSSRILTMSEGNCLSLGQKNLRFIMAPMVHWPEVMTVYEESEHILFSADAFGKFGALCHEPDPQLHPVAWTDEARRYYVNICGKYGAPVQTLLAKAATLDIHHICPLHGPVLHQPLKQYLTLYNTWSLSRPENEGILIAHASIHGHTAQAAQFLYDTLIEGGMAETDVVLLDLCRTPISEAISQAYRLHRIVLAASSYDASVFPPMYHFLHHLHAKGLRGRKLAFIENGSWSPTAGRIMQEMAGQMKDIEVIAPVITLNAALTPANYETRRHLAETLKQ